MKTGEWIAFKRLTGADFFHTSKPRGHDVTGGGQSYIDLAGSAIPLSSWERDFFRGITPLYERQGPAWDVEIQSLRTSVSQTVRIASRTNESGEFRNISIRSQKIHSQRANRVYAWHPHHTAFPDLPGGVTSGADPSVSSTIRDLVIYIIRTVDGEYWAGWFQRYAPDPAWTCDPQLMPMFSESEGLIHLAPGVEFEETDDVWPFRGVGVPEVGVGGTTTGRRASLSPSPTTTGTGSRRLPGAPTGRRRSAPRRHIERAETDVIEDLFDDDLVNDTPEVRRETQRVRARNQRAVRLLKELYKGCQITGSEFVFSKSNGQPYTNLQK